MNTVAVLGGGPAGSFAAERLARAGLRTIVFDEKLAWEKPCGGGLTYKAYKQYPFLIENTTPKKLITHTELAAPKVGSVTMPLSHPLVIYSRLDLNHMLLERAGRAGAQIEKTRVLEIRRQDGRWALKTRNGTAEADYCIVATGARNPLKNVGTEYSAADTACALGYFVPSERERIEIQFLSKLEGYIWVFPRCGHLSVGICGKGEPSHSLRARLEKYMQERDIPYKDAPFYAHILPSLESASWHRNRVSGDGWMAVGDAAGLVDPITGEGLYYAMRSGDIASQTLLSGEHPMEAKAQAYRSAIHHDFMADLAFGAMLAKKVFLGRMLFSTVPAHMVKFVRRSPRFTALMQDLFAGTQPYLGLKSRLLRSLDGSRHKFIMNLFLDKLIPSQEAV